MMVFLLIIERHTKEVKFNVMYVYLSENNGQTNI